LLDFKCFALPKLYLLVSETTNGGNTKTIFSIPEVQFSTNCVTCVGMFDSNGQVNVRLNVVTVSDYEKIMLN